MTIQSQNCAEPQRVYPSSYAYALNRLRIVGFASTFKSSKLCVCPATSFNFETDWLSGMLMRMPLMVSRHLAM